MALDIPPLGNVIATRDYTVVKADGSTEFARVRLGAPIVRPGENEYWVCPYEIVSPSFSHRFYSAGDDSMQALVLATHILASELQSLARKHQAQFLLHGEGDLGLPDIADVAKMHPAGERPH
jgi:hypothetical protein